MPDIVSIGLGGGSIVREVGDQVTVGPDSVGYKITEEARVFGGKQLTTTDIAVRLTVDILLTKHWLKMFRWSLPKKPMRRSSK